MTTQTSSSTSQTDRETEESRSQALLEASAKEHLEELGVIQLKLLTIQGDLSHQVARLRLEGVSWARIGAVLQISAQAAHQRWSADGVEKHRLRQRRLHGLSDDSAE